MPHLRFTRDKRGYENTYIMHSARRRGKGRQRILYWFRTPPNIRVGRAALDEEAIRAIEDSNPDISFDWSKILESRPPAAPLEQADRRRRPRQGPRREREPLPPPVGARAPEAAPGGVAAEISVGLETSTAAPVPGESAAGVPPAPVEIVELPEVEPPALVPVTVYHGGADVVAAAPDLPRRSPIEMCLESEQLGRLRARYAEILARITERVGVDPARLEEMRRAAEALNPDAWVTDDEIAAGLHQFDARLGEIRRTLGIKRRRRSRRGGRRRRSHKGAQTPLATPGAPRQEEVAGFPEEPEELGDESAEGSSDEDENPID